MSDAAFDPAAAVPRTLEERAQFWTRRFLLYRHHALLALDSVSATDDGCVIAVEEAATGMANGDLRALIGRFGPKALAEQLEVEAEYFQRERPTSLLAFESYTPEAESQLHQHERRAGRP